MRLERVVLTGFLSHAATDWSPNGARLVSLVGPNGAGKSSLLDAVSYALFDDARARTDDLVSLGATNMSASVEFAFAGARYRVVRGRSTRAGGKTFLELHLQAADGTWTPLTRDSIRETEAAIAELLRLDAATFATAVMLGQGDANRFADATAGERKRILGQVLGLDVYARAEAAGRDQLRMIEASSVADRSRAERVVDAIAELEPTVDCPECDGQGWIAETTADPLPSGEPGEPYQIQTSCSPTVQISLSDILAARRAELAAAEVSIATAGSARNAANARLRELDVALAQADAISGEIERVKADRDAALEDWRRATDRRGVASANRIIAEATVLSADEVDAAIAAVPDARAEVERLTAGEAEDRRLAAEITAAQRALEEIDRPVREAVTTWRTKRGLEEVRIRELEAHARAGTSVCATCGQTINETQALDQLHAARERFTALGDEPTAPLALAKASAALARLESRRRELAWDPAAMIAARDRLGEFERIAARGETIAAARAALEREAAAIAEADAELRRIEVRGRDMKTRLAGLAEQAAAAEPLRAERIAQAGALSGAETALQAAQDAARAAERGVAAMEASVARLEELRAEQGVLRAALAAAELEIGRLRRLVAAFGVTGIPARIIESVLPELGAYANELLGQLRPGVSLELRAQRAKKDGKGVVEALDLVVRDDVGERPLALFSGGERMSVSLALAVGLSRLVARRAGTAIRTLVIDEPDGLDADARRAFGMALRVLAHQGELERVVLVSHHPDLAEYADEVYQVTKGPGGSRVDLVA